MYSFAEKIRRGLGNCVAADVSHEGHEEFSLTKNCG